MGKHRYTGPVGRYYCPLSEGTQKAFEELMKRYGCTRDEGKKIWRNGEIFRVNWCARDSDGKLLFLVWDDSPSDPAECESLMDLRNAMDDALENFEAWLASADVSSAVEGFDQTQANTEGWGLEENEDLGLIFNIYGPSSNRWCTSDDAEEHVKSRACAGSVYHKAAVSLVERWAKEHDNDAA